MKPHKHEPKTIRKLPNAGPIRVEVFVCRCGATRVVKRGPGMVRMEAWEVPLLAHRRAEEKP